MIEAIDGRTVCVERAYIGWTATLDGYEPPDCNGDGGDYRGWGSTPEEAVADLRESVEEDTRND